ncbi:MAG: ribbon-helix-helix domain-containing protein [Pirellulaceae bacterium]
MAKKRTSLDAVLPAKLPVKKKAASTPKKAAPKPQSSEPTGKRPHVKQQALYLKHPVHRQLKYLAFEEDKKMHDLCMEAIDLLFANRGMKSIEELTSE